VIDWGLARRIGGFISGDPPAGAPLHEDLAAIVDDARARVSAHTGLEPQRPIPPPEAVDRGRWLDLNLVSMKSVFDPLSAKVDQGGKVNGTLKALVGVLLAAEVGVLSGYLAQRVLGQYELVLLDPEAPERLLLVAPNLRDAAERLDVPERDLVAWVAIHEVTHAVQFTSVPWLRGHLAGELSSLLETVDVKVDWNSLLKLPSTADLRALVDRVRQGGLVTLVAGDERMAIIDRVQAAMALIEGHAEHVMDAVGRDVLPTLDELRDALDRRRQDKAPVWRLLEKLLGLELKMKQYELGRAFCDEVVEAGGMAALNRAWTSPEALPTLEEISAPQRWLERTSPLAA
jgi:coenzyme F420 biosynthesis associated uncharacterized protein